MSNDVIRLKDYKYFPPTSKCMALCILPLPSRSAVYYSPIWSMHQKAPNNEATNPHRAQHSSRTYNNGGKVCLSRIFVMLLSFIRRFADSLTRKRCCANQKPQKALRNAVKRFWLVETYHSRFTLHNAPSLRPTMTIYSDITGSS